MPFPPPATSMMCAATPSSGVTRIAGDHVAPSSVEEESQPMSCAPWVSQVAYRFPAESIPSAPSIHHSERDIVPVPGPTKTGVDQCAPPSVDDVKNVFAGSIVYVVVFVMS